jgi:translocator protein
MMIPAWMAIAAITILVSLGANLFTSPADNRWFRQLRRPRWLSFEAFIPIIWTVILICGAVSAHEVWMIGGIKYGLVMATYLLLEIAIILYVPITLQTRNLKLGTAVGLVGFGIGVVLTAIVGQISGWAAILLVPHLLWSPIGSYATWAIAKLNRN